MINYKNDEEFLDNVKIRKINSLEDYSIQQDGIIYKIILKELDDIINIKCNKYELDLNLNDFISKAKKDFTSLNDCYKFLSSQFQDNNITLKIILNSKYFLFSYYDQETNQDIDFKLIYKENSEDSSLSEIVKNYNELYDAYQFLKDELKEMKKNKSLKFKAPKNITFSSDVIKNSFAGYSYEDSFIIFKSIDDIIQLVYATKEKAIISYDLEKKRNIVSRFKAHKNFITNFKYIIDRENNKDIVMSLSKKDNNLKIWNANSWEIIGEIINVNKTNFLYSACFLQNDNDIFIISSNGKNLQSYHTNENFENMKLYTLKGEFIKEINDTNDSTYFIDTYYDENLSKIFIVTGNYNYVKSYDFDNNKLYNKYFENNNGIHPSVLIYKIGAKIKLIESCEDGNIRIWGFHSGELIRKINTENNNLYGICLWNENYIFVGCKDQSIKLLELKNGLLIKNLKGHNGRIISFKKMVLPNNKECLLSQGLDGTIKLWTYSENERI